MDPLLSDDLAILPQGAGLAGGALVGSPVPGQLRIAMIATPYFAIPPAGYGGAEAVVAELVNGLVERGHHITLIAAGSHGTRAQRFLASYEIPPGDRLHEALPEVIHAACGARAIEDCDVDVVHDHTLAGPLLARGRLTPTVVTPHSPLDGELGSYYRTLGDTVRMVAISAAQRAAAPDLPWTATVHNAVRVATFPLPGRQGRLRAISRPVRPRQGTTPGH
ncbi:MAG: glycosyltransferase [Pseudonocardiaceae bacterium]